MKYFLIFFFLLKMSQLQASSQDCFKQSGLTALTSNNFNPRAGVNLQMLTMQSSDTSKADCIYNYLNKELPYAIDDYIQASGCGKASTKDLADCKQVRDYANHVLNTFWDNSNSIFPKLTDEENIERAEAKNKDFDQWHPIDQVASKMRERRETLDQGLEAYQNKFSNISEIFRTCQEGSNDHIQKTITPFLTACAPSSILQQEDTLNDLSETSQKIAQQLDKENFDQYNQAILQGVSEISIRQTLQAIWAEKAHAYGSHYFDGDCTNLKAHQSQGHQALAGKDLSATCAKKKRERARAAICGGDTGSWRWDGTK